MKQAIRLLGIAGLSCLFVGSALAQSPTDKGSGAASQADRPVPPDPSSPNRPAGVSSGRSNQEVQAPRENQGVQSPRVRDYSPGQRATQDVQSPRDNQNVQSPRNSPDVQSPRGRGIRRSSADIRSAQEALKAKGFDPGEVDGRYGPNTRAAITKYQRDNGLRETGRFDEATLSHLGVSGSPSNRSTGR
jgi:hypothetical protein